VSNLELFDDRGRVLRALEHAEQAENLERVSGRIGAAILSFCRGRVGKTFHADELRLAVESSCGHTAPGSADRILRALRAQHRIDYAVLNRAKSLYRIAGVA